MRLTVNGSSREYTGDPNQPLLWFLRDELQLTGTKFGCGVSACGACTVHVDGAPVTACVTTMGTLEGRTVVTIEGLDGNGQHAVQRAWTESNVPQCGYCQSGQIMAAAALLSAKPQPTDQDIDNAMNGVICRCGTYPRIREAIKRAAGLPPVAAER